MKTTLSSKGQIVLPTGLRRRDGLAAGNVFEIERIESGEYLLRRLPAATNSGLVDWLLACPAKDGLVAAIEGESTGALRPPALIA